MVHGLATWGMCLSLKAAENDIRAAWHAACNVEVFVMRAGVKRPFLMAAIWAMSRSKR